VACGAGGKLPKNEKRLQKAQKRKRKTTNLVIFWRATRHAK
jgi:hypothetical protein